jgi:hypothetical protein
MEPEDPLPVKKLLQPISSSVPKSSRSWIGSAIVILAAVFLLLTLNEGQSSPQQRVIDSLFHSWFVMSAATAVIWLTRREVFGLLPSLIRALSGLLFAVFLLVSMLDFFLWPPLWDVLKPFGLARANSLPIAVMGVFAVWGIGIAVLVVRGTFRWFRRRYEHHGVAVGFGPLYFYFRRRRAS